MPISNPYLADQANAITNQANQNLTNYQLPAINSGAIAAGGFGGSRQGVAQGLAIGQTNQGITNSLAGLYGNAYAQDQQIASQQAMQQAQLAAQERMASQSNQTTRDLGFGNLGLGYTQAGNQYGLGLGNLALGNKQADQSYGLGQYNAQTQRDLGFGNLGLGYTQAENQYNLGQGNLALGNKQADQSYGLGMGNLGLGFQNSANQFTLGQQQNANTAQANQNQYNLGLGNLGLGQQQASNNYNLGLGQLGLGQYNAETSRGLGYGQLQQTGDQNAFNQQQQGFNSQLAALNALMGWNTNGVNMANQQQQTPLQNLGQLSNIGASIGGQGGSTSQPGPSTIGSAAGGALTLAQLYRLLSGG